MTRCLALASPGAAGAHEHVAWIDPRTGNGRTDPGPDGHVHRIVNWHADVAEDGHGHAIACPSDGGTGPGGGA
jgi:hypothetical protein